MTHITHAKLNKMCSICWKLGVIVISDRIHFINWFIALLPQSILILYSPHKSLFISEYPQPFHFHTIIEDKIKTNKRNISLQSLFHKLLNLVYLGLALNTSTLTTRRDSFDRNTSAFSPSLDYNASAMAAANAAAGNVNRKWPQSYGPLGAMPSVSPLAAPGTPPPPTGKFETQTKKKKILLKRHLRLWTSNSFIYIYCLFVTFSLCNEIERF